MGHRGGVDFSLTDDEALVLFELLARISKDERSGLFEDHAEELVLWRLEAVLEKTLVAPFRRDYAERLRQARDRVRAER